MTSTILPFTNINKFSNTAMAQKNGYDDYVEYNSYLNDNTNKIYSGYPDEENKYECRTGPFEGFFVSSPEFCLAFDDDDKKKKKDRPVVTPPIEGATLSINKDWFVCNNDDIDCIIGTPEQQISFEGPNSGNYTQCASDGQCPFANDAGFNITINGSNPIPNTIPAQVNTTQQVGIGAGPFSITEQLFSDELVPDANFEVENVPLGQNIGIVSGSFIIAFDEAGQRVFTANGNSHSVSIIDLANSNNVTNIDLFPSGAIFPAGIAFDEAGQRVFTANAGSDSVSIIDLANANTVTNVPLEPSGGLDPRHLAFDEAGQRVFTSNFNNSVSIIELANSNTVTTVDVPPSGGCCTGSPLVFDEAGQRVFTPLFLSDSLFIIDLANANTVTSIPLRPSGGEFPIDIAFDEAGQRVFTANGESDSVSIIDLANANTVTNVPLLPSGGDGPEAIAFDAVGQRVFTANAGSDSVSIIDLANANTVTNVPLLPSGGDGPSYIAFDEAGQRIFTANAGSDSVSIIDLANANTVTNVPLEPSGGDLPVGIAFDEAGQRVFTPNQNSDSVSIISLPPVSKICQDSGFDTGDVRTFISNGGQTIQQTTCVNFVGECSGNIQDGETRECTVQDYVIKNNASNSTTF
jgi:YVTN family beta-propeller protein